jgi:hypothetical protein
MKVTLLLHPSNMKLKIIFPALVVLLFISTMAVAQGKYPVAKVYAYSQQEMSGVNRKLMDKDGKVIRSRNNATSYFLYLESYTGKKITIESVWIGGKSYSFEMEKTITPVILSRSLKSPGSPAADTLVASTANDVFIIRSGITPANVAAGKTINRLKKKNAVLFVYSYEGKKYYLGVKAFKQLQPEIRQ